MSTSTRETVQLGKTKYIQGNFYSNKNKGSYPYKSSYELAYLHLLENDPTVHQYIYEPFSLYYKDVNDKQRSYLPDFMVLYTDGTMEIAEIKPTIMLKDYDVRAKALACELYLKETFKDLQIPYKFVTEKDLFASDKEYQDFIKSIK